MLLLALLLLAVTWLWVVVRVVGCLGVGAREFDSVEKPSYRGFSGVLRDQRRHRVWKRLRICVPTLGSDDDGSRRQSRDLLPFGVLVEDRVGDG